MPAGTTYDDPTGVVIATWRAESARLVGALTRMTRDVDLAEDLAQDALVAALEQWPVSGIPDNPSAWLMTTAKRRGVDHFRRAETLRRKVAELEHAEGFSGIPETGHCSRAATRASWARSSARSTSRVIRVRAPTRRADSARHVAITTPVGSSYVVPAGTWPA